MQGLNRTLTDDDVAVLGKSMQEAVEAAFHTPLFIELITNIIDGALEVKLKPIHARLDGVDQRLDGIQRGLRVAGGAET